MMGYIEELQSTIRRLHGCESDYLESVPVTETFQGKTVWQGDVEVFAIRGHPTAKRCYAWAHETSETGKRYVAVLELPPVVSAETAVRAAIIEEYRTKHGKQETS